MASFYTLYFLQDIFHLGYRFENVSEINFFNIFKNVNLKKALNLLLSVHSKIRRVKKLL